MNTGRAVKKTVLCCKAKGKAITIVYLPTFISAIFIIRKARYEKYSSSGLSLKLIKESPFRGASTMRIWKIENKNMLYEIILKTTPEKMDQALNEKNKDKYYNNSFEIRKKHGKRQIYCVEKENQIFSLQKNLTEQFLKNIMLSDAVYGFVEGTNYLDFLNEHTSFQGTKNYLRLDIKSFFDTIREDRIREVLQYYISDECRSKTYILDKIIDILLYNGRVIQGAPSSPAISNIIFRQIDLRIQKYCNKCRVDYSRYVDDLLFSSDNNNIHHSRFISGISHILSSYGFKINYQKTIQAKNEISLGGFVISTDIRLSRKKLKNLKRVLYFLDHNKFVNTEEYFKQLTRTIKKDKGSQKFESKYQLENYLAGYRSFLVSVKRYSKNENYKCHLDKTIDSIEKKIDVIEQNK